MTAVSMRPFYRTFAWAYPLLIEAPIEERCDFIQTCFTAAGVPPGSRLLDVGCGPGQYSLELARRGYQVTGMDASPDFIQLASCQAATESLPVTFLEGDLLSLPNTATYDGILCRGVLNDLCEDAQRNQVLPTLAHAIRSGGLLLFDVRDWPMTLARKRQHPRFEKTVQTERGWLTFRSDTHLDEAQHRLLIAEAHILEQPHGPLQETYQFVMRCWTDEEVATQLARAGCTRLACWGDYDATMPVGATDRLVYLVRRTS